MNLFKFRAILGTYGLRKFQWMNDARLSWDERSAYLENTLEGNCYLLGIRVTDFLKVLTETNRISGG